jgi:hypothetical protein
VNRAEKDDLSSPAVGSTTRPSSENADFQGICRQPGTVSADGLHMNRQIAGLTGARSDHNCSHDAAIVFYAGDGIRRDLQGFQSG